MDLVDQELNRIGIVADALHTFDLLQLLMRLVGDREIKQLQNNAPLFFGFQFTIHHNEDTLNKPF